MRKAIILLTALILAASAVSANKDIDITPENIDPVPAEPGDTVDIYITVKNDGSSDATVDPIEVETIEGMKFLGTTSDFRNEFRLCGGCQKVGHLYLKVVEDAESGSYPVDIVATSGDSGTVEKMKIRVDGSPELIFNARTKNIVPGKNFSMNLSVENTGTDTASGVVINPSKDGFGFTPNEVALGKITPGETRYVILEGEVDSDVEAGIQTIALDASFRDDSTEKTRNINLPVKVLERAELAIADFDVGNAVRGSPTTVTLELENLGPGEAEKIVSTLECEGGEIASGKSFVGKLGQEESVPVTFEVVPKQKDISCSIRASYTDHRQRNVEESFSFQPTSKSNPLPLVVVGLIVIGVAVFYWRKKRRDELEEI